MHLSKDVSNAENVAGQSIVTGIQPTTFGSELRYTMHAHADDVHGTPDGWTGKCP